jgi:hypothetical protein
MLFPNLMKMPIVGTNDEQHSGEGCSARRPVLITGRFVFVVSERCAQNSLLAHLGLDLPPAELPDHAEPQDGEKDRPQQRREHGLKGDVCIVR